MQLRPVAAAAAALAEVGLRSLKYRNTSQIRVLRPCGLCRPVLVDEVGRAASAASPVTE